MPDIRQAAADPRRPELYPSHAEKGPAYHMQDILWIMLADREDTGGRWSMMEQLMPMGAGPPPHRHLWSDETFYILDGEITFLHGDTIETAGKGAFVNIARNTRHAFRVDSPTARILNGYTPGEHGGDGCRAWPVARTT